MRRNVQKKSLFRNGVIATLILGLLAGLAYAFLQTQATVTGSTISTDSANLLISADGVHYGKSIPGFSFTDALPGGYAAPADGYPIYLKNTGDTDLDLDLSIPDAPSNPGAADLNEINFGLTDTSGQTSPHGFIIQSLIDGHKPIDGDLAPGATREYKLQLAMQLDAAQGVTIGNIDLAFTGTPRDANNPNQAQYQSN